jgi:hypothetical protein
LQPFLPHHNRGTVSQQPIGKNFLAGFPLGRVTKRESLRFQADAPALILAFGLH